MHSYANTNSSNHTTIMDSDMVLEIIKLLSLPDAVKFCQGCGIPVNIAFSFHGSDVYFILIINLE